LSFPVVVLSLVESSRVPTDTASLSNVVRLNMRPILMVIIAMFLITGPAIAGDLSRTQPHPSLSPQDVVTIVMRALKNNDVPTPDRGIEITFNFASPANKQMTGPLTRFIPMVKGPVYGNMIGYRSFSLENKRRRGDIAVIDAILTLQSSAFAGFRFQLSLQKNNQFCGSWMTDAVFPIKVDAL
jgi:hypothetical protein